MHQWWMRSGQKTGFYVSSSLILSDFTHVFAFVYRCVCVHFMTRCVGCVYGFFQYACNCVLVCTLENNEPGRFSK